MIIEVTRGHLKFGFNNKIAIVQGEMFFPENEKMGFVVYSDTLNKWESPNESIEISEDDRAKIFEMLQREFSNSGNIIEFE